MTETVVFDTEALIALAFDEPGSERVEDLVRAVETGDKLGVVNTVTCTEIRYVITNDANERTAERFVSSVREWCTVASAESVWMDAARFKSTYSVPLGDAFVVATARARDATAVVGADDDFEEIDAVAIERFRTDSV